MINLLPILEKQKLLLRKNEKLATIWGSVILIAVICLVLILLAIKFYILVEADYYKIALKQAEQTNITADFASINSLVQEYNKALSQLNSFYQKEVYFSKVLENIISVASPKGLFINNFSLKRKDNGVVQISVSGISDTRDNLIIFKKNIEANKQILNPSFSAESWINPKNVNFVLTFEASL